MEKITTTDLTEFGKRELLILRDLIDLMEEQGLPEHFDDHEVTIMYNMESEKVFLTNSSFQSAMINDGNLEMFHTLPYGEEGFAEDLRESYEEDSEYFHEEDIEYMREYGII